MDEVIEAIRSVTAADIQEVAGRLVRDEALCAAVIGPNMTARGSRRSCASHDPGRATRRDRRRAGRTWRARGRVAAAGTRGPSAAAAARRVRRRVRRPTQGAVSPCRLGPPLAPPGAPPGPPSTYPLPLQWGPPCGRAAGLASSARTAPATSRGSALPPPPGRTPPAASGWPTAAAARLGPTGRTAPPRWAGARRFSSTRAARSERAPCPWSRSASARPDAPWAAAAAWALPPQGDATAARRCAPAGRRDAAAGRARLRADPATGPMPPAVPMPPPPAPMPQVSGGSVPARGDGGSVGGAARGRRA